MTESDDRAAPDDQHDGDDEPADGRVADGRVAEAVRRLDALADLPPAEHVEVYESVHRDLQESLAEAADTGDESGESSSGDDRSRGAPS